MNLNFTITFFDYWHTSSGLSAGAKLDSSVIKDENNLPYLAGKTIKGLVREMAETLDNREFINECFGVEGEDMGKCYFSNAELDSAEQEQIISHKLQDNLYEIIASTQIGANGIAVDGSLRETEVVVPLMLHASISDIASLDDYKKLVQSLQLIKRVGLNRHRGLGRCSFKMEKR